MNTLTDQNIIDTAKTCGIEPAVLKAIAIVESSGSGYLPSGRCKILFEGHIFWRQLVMVGINPKNYALKNPCIVYEKWDKTKQDRFLYNRFIAGETVEEMSSKF